MSLIHWYPLINDASDLGLKPINGTLIGSASFIDGGKLGKCLSAGTGSATTNGVNVSTNLLSELGSNYSVACWIKVNGNHYHYNGTILSSGNWNGSCWAFGLSQDNTQVDIFGSGYNKYITLPSALTTGTWYHLASVQKSGINYVYLNGTLVGTASITAIYTSDASNMCIGRETYADGYFTFNGNINDLRIYNHALSPKEIKELSKGLRLHYPMKQPRGFSDLASDIGLGVYNNYGVSASLSATGGSFMGYPIYRLTMTPTSANVSDFRTSLFNHGVYQSSYTYAASTPYSYWIYYKPVTHPDVRVGGTASNISGWIEHSPEYFGNGWWRVGQYRNGGVTETKTDSIFTSFYTPTAAAGVPISIDFCGPHLISGTSSIIETFGLETPAAQEYDTSGYGQHGTIVGTIYGHPGTPIHDLGYYFGSSSYIKLPTLSFTGMANSYTFSWWSCKSSMDGCMAWGFGDGNRLNLYPSSYFCWNTGDGSNNPFRNSSGTGISFTPYNGAWHHYAITGNGTTTTLYIDGSAVGTAKTYKPLTGTQIYISGWDTTSSYKWAGGHLSDYRIYATCLSAADIKELYNTPMATDNFGNIFTREIKEN